MNEASAVDGSGGREEQMRLSPVSSIGSEFITVALILLLYASCHLGDDGGDSDVNFAQQPLSKQLDLCA